MINSVFFYEIYLYIVVICFVNMKLKKKNIVDCFILNVE